MKPQKSLLLKNIFSSWVVFFLNIIISFFLAPFVVHSLGNTYYGVWVIMMQFTGYLYLMDFGVRESIIRYTSKYTAETGEESEKTDINAFICSAIVLYSMIGLLCLMVSLVLAYYFSSIFNVPEETVSDAVLVVIITGVTLSQFFMFNVYSGIMMGLKRYDLMNKVGVVFSLIRPAVIVIVLSMGYGIVALAIIQFVIGLLNNLFVYYFAKKLMAENEIPYKFKYLGYRENKKYYKEIFNYSVYVLINNIGQKAIFHTDAVVIGIFMSAASVTFYAIAGNLVNYLISFCTIGVQVLNPMVSEMDTRQDKGEIRKTLHAGCKLSLVAGLPIAIVYITMGGNFIGLWMGDEYKDLSGSVLILLALMQFYSLPHYTISSVLYGMSKHHIIAKLRIVEALMNVTLSVILVQDYGLYGVALGTLIPHFLIMVIVLPILIKDLIDLKLGSFYMDCYIRPMLSGIPFYALCYFVASFYQAQSLIVFFAVVLLLLPVYLVSTWFISFGVEERTKYKNAVLGHFFKSYQSAT